MFVDAKDSKYDIKEKKVGGMSGRKQSPEAIARMVATRSNPDYINPTKGKPWTPEAIAKSNATRAANKLENPNYIHPNTGTKMPPEEIAQRTATRAANRAKKLAEKK